MKYRAKLAAYAALPVLGLTIAGATAVSAHGLFGFGGWNAVQATPEEIATRQQTIFQKEADLLGISVDDVKNAWAQGKTIAELAKEKGITEGELQQKMKAAMTQEMKARLQTLVDKGVITQAQADQRLKFLESRPNKQKHMMGKGFHRGFGF